MFLIYLRKNPFKKLINGLFTILLFMRFPQNCIHRREARTGLIIGFSILGAAFNAPCIDQVINLVQIYGFHLGKYNNL